VSVGCTEIQCNLLPVLQKCKFSGQKLIVFRPQEPVLAVLAAGKEREADREFEILLPHQSEAFGQVVTAAAVFDADVYGRDGEELHGHADTQRHGILSQFVAVVGLVVGSVTESGPVGPAFQEITHIVAVGGVLHAGLDRMRIGICHRKGAPVRSADAGGFGLPVAAAPVLIDVIHPHRPLGGLVEDTCRKLTGQYECQMRRIALYGGVVEVTHIDIFRHRGIEVAAEIILIQVENIQKS